MLQPTTLHNLTDDIAGTPFEAPHPARLARRPTILHAMAFRPKGRGSFELFLLELARRQAVDGWRVHFLFCGEPVDWFARELQGYAGYSVADEAPLGDPGFEALEALMQRLQPDLLSLTFCSLFSPRALRIARQTTTVFLDHSSWTVPERTGLSQLAARVRGAVAGHCYAKVISCSELNRQRNITRSYLPAEKCVRVYNGVPNAGAVRPEPPANLPVAPGRYFFFAGQLARFKGVHTLINAFDRLAEKMPPDVQLLLAGSGPDEAELRQQAARSRRADRIHFLGRRDDVPALMAHSLATVVPSEWREAFGLVVAEAMASGTVVIGSNAGAVPEVLGAAGIVFESGDVVALASIMRDVAYGHIDRQWLIKRARTRVAANFTIERMVDGYARELNELIEQPAPAPLALSPGYGQAA